MKMLKKREILIIDRKNNIFGEKRRVYMKNRRINIISIDWDHK